ncbi:MAG TPA: O-antigen ligase family protein [Solirubrobacteraceae bacterium]|nr:O-antigen ligase family protein [Solirubrobacteraceae bacterium]
MNARTARVLPWAIGGLAAATFAAIDVELAYKVSPVVALGLPIAIVATVYFFYRPMVGVYVALLCVPAEALNLSFGSFGLTPTKALLLLVGGVVFLRFLLSGTIGRPHPAYIAFLLGQAVTILGLLVAKDTFTVIKIWVTWSAFLAVSMLVASAEARQIKVIFYCLCVGGAILALESLSHGTSQTLVNGGRAATDRAQGSFTHPAQLAFWLLLSISPTLILAMIARPGLRAPVLGAAALSIAALLLTLTRGAVVGFAGSLLVLLSWARFRRFALALLAIAAIYTAVNFETIAHSREISVVTTRISTVSEGASAGGERLLIWKTTPSIIAGHPLLGVGAGNFPKISLEYGLSEDGLPFQHAHDLLLTVAAERGLIAAGLLIWFLVAIAKTGIDAIRDRRGELYPYALGLCAALFGLFLDSFVDYPPGQDAVMGTLMIEVGALIALERHMRASREAGATGSLPERS